VVIMKRHHLPTRHAAFYDILPAGIAPAPELPPFPGALRFDDMREGLRLKVVHTPAALAPAEEAVLTVTDQPFKDRAGVWHLEVVFDRHMEANHPGIHGAQFSSCCYRNVRLADLGVVTYPDGRWSQTTYSVEYNDDTDNATA
jgi:hypothetical protein